MTLNEHLGPTPTHYWLSALRELNQDSEPVKYALLLEEIIQTAIQNCNCDSLPKVTELKEIGWHCK